MFSWSEPGQSILFRVDMGYWMFHESPVELE